MAHRMPANLLDLKFPCLDLLTVLSPFETCFGSMPFFEDHPTMRVLSTLVTRFHAFANLLERFWPDLVWMDQGTADDHSIFEESCLSLSRVPSQRDRVGRRLHDRCPANSII